MYVRKAELPKRLAVSSGGHSDIVFSARSSTLKRPDKIGCSGFEDTVDIGVSFTDSARFSTKAIMVS